ncbi:MAG: phosphatidylinositol mannoside acyltransferase, partial [Actinobacteria bacterium]|nr:phosphatidylinositol mannoside acyltransferase [Actinomycetota bacterium]
PAPVARAAAQAAGVVMTSVMRDRKAMVARHQQRAAGRPMTRWALERQVRRTFASYARYWAESLRLPTMSADELDRLMSYEGLEHLDTALGGGCGAIMATPHLGAWDPGAAWFTRRGYPLTVVVEPLEPPEVFAWFVEFRRSIGMEIVPLGPSAGTAVIRALKANRPVALLSDRDLLGTGAEVEFFGERTTLPSGPATLALRTGAPLLPVAIYFRNPEGYHGVMRPPIAVERQGSLREDVARITQLLAGELEQFIRRAPEQWHLLQPNWPSDRPERGDRRERQRAGR